MVALRAHRTTGSDRYSGSHERVYYYSTLGADVPLLLREGQQVFILRENGTKELYTMGTGPYQGRSTARTADPALIARLTTSAKEMRVASEEARRQLEAAP